MFVRVASVFVHVPCVSSCVMSRLLCVIAVCATKNGKWMVVVGGGWCGGDH